jgi:phosphatidate cytidylyltransferase
VTSFDADHRKNLATRAISAAVLLPVAVVLAVIGGLPLALLAGAIAALAASELILMFGAVGVAEAFGIAVAGSIPVVAALAKGQDLFPGWAAAALASAVVVLLSTFLFRRERLETIPPRIATVVLTWLYCGLLLSTVVGLRRIGLAWILLALVITWANDTFAYFAGVAFGRHRMLERISPKKTWEGFAGGAAGTVALALAARWLMKPELGALSVGTTVLVAAGGALLGPLGDFCESLLKRAAGVKDSGKLIPGHGGMLDRIDALLFVVPWVYLWAAYLTR